MTRIEQLELILEELTGYAITQGTIETGYSGIWIQPAQIYNTFDFNDVEYFDIVVIESTLAALEAKKTAFLKVKTSLDFDYNNYDARGYISVANGSLFDLADEVTGASSLATGTVYAIESNILFLKDVTGTWETAESITDGDDSTSTTTSTLTPLTFPYYVNNSLVRYDYDLDYNASVGGIFSLWVRFEARWDL